MNRCASFVSVFALLLVIGQQSFASDADQSVGVLKSLVVTAEEDALQKLFFLGLYASKQQNYKASIAIFSDMLKRTSSPRVKLELARSLFLDRQFQASKSIYQEVLSGQGVPWSVKQNIRLYLNQIDSDIGYVKFGISFVSDSNPENFTSSEEVNISGRTLKVVRPSGDQEVMGVRYSMDSGFPLSDDSRTQAYLNASFSDFEGGKLERWISDIGIVSSFESLPRVKVKAGVEYSEQNGRKRYDFSYLSTFYTPNIADQFRYNYQFRAGRLVIHGAPHLDAHVYRATANFTKSLQNDFFADGSLAFEKSVARETPYSYHEGTLALGLDMPINDWGVRLSSSASLRFYGDIDPFFGERRRDFKKKLGFVLSNERIHTYGYKPEIGLTYEKNNSSLGYFEYDKISLVFSLVEGY